METLRGEHEKLNKARREGEIRKIRSHREKETSSEVRERWIGSELPQK